MITVYWPGRWTPVDSSQLDVCWHVCLGPCRQCSVSPPCVLRPTSSRTASHPGQTPRSAAAPAKACVLVSDARYRVSMRVKNNCKQHLFFSARVCGVFSAVLLQLDDSVLSCDEYSATPSSTVPAGLSTAEQAADLLYNLDPGRQLQHSHLSNIFRCQADRGAILAAEDALL